MNSDIATVHAWAFDFILKERDKESIRVLGLGAIVGNYAGDEPVIVFAHATTIHPKSKDQSVLIIAVDLG